AVLQVMPYIKEDENILILYGDVPLISLVTLQNLLQNQPKEGIALLTAFLANPTGYGRILRQDGNITGIIEQKDANQQQQQINEINTGIMLVDGKKLIHWLSKIDNNNNQQE